MLVKSLFNRNPFDMAREMDRLFESMVSSQPLSVVPTIRTGWSWPAVNMWEDERSFHVEAELPGLTMEDLEILATDDELTIKGERTVHVPEGGRALRRERGVGGFERTVALPSPVDIDRIEANLRDGILSIRLPKTAEAQPRKIEVRTA